MHILFLSQWFPFPASNGSKLRIFNLLRALAQRHTVSLISFADQAGVDPAAPALQAICDRIEVVPVSQYRPDGWRARLGFLSAKPRYYLDMYSPPMAERIERVLAAASYDLVIASQTQMAGYVDHFHGVPALFEEVEVATLFEEYAQAGSLSRRARRGLTWAKHRRYLSGLLHRYRASTVASEEERQLLQETISLNGNVVEVVPNCIDVDSYRPFLRSPQPDSLIYTGSFTYAPNYEAMAWFVGKVLPLVQTAVPPTTLTITGNPGARPLPPAKNVDHVGFVDDVRPLVAGSWISLAPLQTGGGTRLKILEAMALETAVIATSKGAEGLDAVDGVHLLIADSPQAFAEATITLLQEPALRQRLAENGYHFVKEQYDWTAVAPKLLSLIDEITDATR